MLHIIDEIMIVKSLFISRGGEHHLLQHGSCAHRCLGILQKVAVPGKVEGDENWSFTANITKPVSNSKKKRRAPMQARLKKCILGSFWWKKKSYNGAAVFFIMSIHGKEREMLCERHKDWSDAQTWKGDEGREGFVCLFAYLFVCLFVRSFVCPRSTWRLRCGVKRVRWW